MKGLVSIILTSIISAFVAVFIFQKVHTPDQIVIRETMPVRYETSKRDMPSHTPSEPYEAPVLTNVPRDFVMASNRARRAVVSIQARTPGGLWRNDFSASSGSGVVISPDGYIATNKHVIDEGEEISITLDDQRVFEAQVIGKDPTTDLALLKIDANDLVSIEFGDSDSLYVGDWVLAIGNPFRLQSTVTAGIVSAKSRNISILPDQTGIEAFIQTDAAVNPGNSGGALVNTSGELVGINTAIITYSGQYEGFSFAIPSNLAAKILDDLKKYGKVQRGWMGVTIRSVDDQLAKDLGLAKVSGVYIDRVIENGAAFDAGLRDQDVIVGVNGKPVAGSPQFMEQVARLRPGDIVKIDYFRSGSQLTADVILSTNPNSTALRSLPGDNPADFEIDINILEQIGLSVRELTDSEKVRIDRAGVMVTAIEPGSRVDNINLHKDYIITSVNGKAVKNVDELVAALEEASEMVIFDGFYEALEEKYPYAFRMD